MIIYDGTWDGLLTVIYDAYHSLDQEPICAEQHQLSLIDCPMSIQTDKEKANRVKKRLIETFSSSFYADCQCVFQSSFEHKADVIAKLIKKLFFHGILYIHSAEQEAVDFRSILKKVRREIHAYKGLLRFRELENGTLYAAFRPEHDILQTLVPHFVRRLPLERFIIHDVGRHNAVFYQEKQLKTIKMVHQEFVDSEFEQEIQQAWLSFYDSVSIQERASQKRMISNMPKKHWEFLTERQTIKKKDGL